MPPTLFDIAGIGIPDSFKGNSLLPRVKGEADGRECVFMQISESQTGRAIRTKSRLYSVRAHTNGWRTSAARVYYEEFYYDLEKDPLQKHNLVKAPEYAEERKKAAALLTAEMLKAGESAPLIRAAK